MSNHITEQEAREAAERVCEMANDCASGEFGVVTAQRLYGTQDMELAERCGRRDVERVARWACDELSRRDTERAEREKPIDAEWLESIGANLNEWNTRFPIHVMNAGTHVIGWAERRGVFAWNNGISYLFDGITTRGQLLDLLAALKGGVE